MKEDIINKLIEKFMGNVRIHFEYADHYYIFDDDKPLIKRNLYRVVKFRKGKRIMVGKIERIGNKVAWKGQITDFHNVIKPLGKFFTSYFGRKLMEEIKNRNMYAEEVLKSFLGDDDAKVIYEKYGGKNFAERALKNYFIQMFKRRKKIETE